MNQTDNVLSVAFCSLNTILSYLPKQRRTGLFSATQTKEVEKLIRAGMRNPVRITVKEKGSGPAGDVESVVRTPSTLKNQYMVGCVCGDRGVGKGSRCITSLRILGNHELPVTAMVVSTTG